MVQSDNQFHCKLTSQIEQCQAIINSIDQEYDSYYVKYSGQSLIKVQKSINKITSLRKQIMKLQLQAQVLNSTKTKIKQQIDQNKLQLEKIEISKIKQCQQHFQILYNYADRHCFKSLAEKFANQFLQCPKTAINNLLLFTGRYQSKNIHKQTQKMLENLQQSYQKLSILYYPRIQTIQNYLKQQKKQLIKYQSIIQSTQRKMITLRIDQEIQMNQYSNQLANHQQRLNQSNIFIKRHSEIVAEEYKRLYQADSSCLVDFQELMISQFMKKLNSYCQNLQKIEELTSLLNNSTDNNNNQSGQQKIQQTTYQATILSTQTDRIPHLQRSSQQLQQSNRQCLSFNINSKKYKVYTKMYIGQFNNLTCKNVKVFNYNLYHFRGMELHSKQIIFWKNTRVQKIGIDRIIKIQKIQKQKLIVLKLIKGYLLVKIIDDNFEQLWNQMKKNYPSILFY